MSVIVPFAGSEAELESLRQRLASVARMPRDEVIVSDSREHPIRTPAYARNRGAAQASGEWLVFIDADTIPEPELLDAYFEPPPADTTAIMAGGIRDAAPPGAGAVARHAMGREQLSHAQTLGRHGTPYAQTANCAVRRSAFIAVDGFEESARAGEDADLCFRLADAGWRLEARPEARVTHRPRATLWGWLAQLAVHGSGAAWLERRWPGEFPRTPVRRLVARVARHAADALRAVIRGEPEHAQFAVLDLLGACAFELGRLLPNTRSAGVARRAAGKPS